MSFSKVLIANRGEIAARVIRSARASGYRTVAVFSEADAGAAHVQLADEAVAIGPARVADSYLHIERILDAATRANADAVHPGYGFLSENAHFAQACADAGLVFVGPPVDAIRAMGDKAQAKARMKAAGVPTVPGYFEADQSDERLRKEATRIGFPLLVKAVSGGGGRGMRLVRAADELDESLEGARREGKSAFGDDTLMLERFIERARHVEIQVFADTHGNAVHLFERDCSTQRRRQKVIEEAPSPIVDADLRTQMGKDAVAAALAVGYVGAGTVELIVDETREYFFLEMNTRLQVEHPVTELVTGFDLVDWQLRVAAGEPLPVTQNQIELDGHAIEARLYAEDPYDAFAPQTGKVHWFQPEGVSDRPGVRVDLGIRQGDTITPHYDSMIAKVIAHGADRDTARRRLIAALEDAPLVGVTTNQQFLVDLLRTDAFRNAEIDTATLDTWVVENEGVMQKVSPGEGTWAIAAIARTSAAGDWFRSASPAQLEVTLEHEGEVQTLRVTRGRDGSAHVTGANIDQKFESIHWANEELEYEQDRIRRKALVLNDGDLVYVCVAAAVRAFREKSPYPQKADQDDPTRIVAAVAGTVVDVSVDVGAQVSGGDTVAVIEAMKMETKLQASRDGAVRAVHVAVGDQVETGELVAELEVSEESDEHG